MTAPSPIAASTIASQAFRFMELSAISSFGDDTPQAQAASEQYPIALKICLEQQDFSFARRLVTLPEASLPEGRAADPDLIHVYKLPGDCVKLRSVTDNTVSWRSDDEYLFADRAGGLPLRYTRLITNEAVLPGLFQTAVAYQLAILLMPTYVGSRTKRSEIKSDAAEALALVKQNDARTASEDRWDGGDSHVDWVAEALR